MSDDRDCIPPPPVPVDVNSWRTPDLMWLVVAGMGAAIIGLTLWAAL